MSIQSKLLHCNRGLSMHLYTWEMCMLMEMVFCCTTWRTRSRRWNRKSATLLFHGGFMWWLYSWTKLCKCVATWSTSRNSILVPSCHKSWWIFKEQVVAPFKFSRYLGYPSKICSNFFIRNESWNTTNNINTTKEYMA